MDVRIIAATNRDLETAVAEGRFREDLYYRLNVVNVWLSPLRDRPGDIELLADYFLTRFAREMGTDNVGMSEEAKALLTTRPWPGNVRELANTIEKALILGRGGPITYEDISQAIGSDQVPPAVDDTDDEAIRQWVRKVLAAGIGKDTFTSLTDRFASMVIAEALNLTRDNRTLAAKLLGLSRPTLLSKIEKYHLKVETSVKTDSD